MYIHFRIKTKKCQLLGVGTFYLHHGSNDLKESVNILVLMLALQISVELVREKFFAEDDLFCATVHKEHEKNGSERRPSHFVFAAFDHRKADSGDAGSVTEFCLRKVEHFAKGNEIVRENVLIFFDLLIDICEPYYFTTVEWEWTNTDVYANCYACAAAFDYKGNVTPMWMSELYEWTMDDIRPIEEFIEKWEANKGNTQLMMVRPASKR